MCFVIEVKNLSFAFGGNTVLKNVSFSIVQGEFVALFGPNGGGKTTLCKLLVGLLKPDSGSLVLPKKIAFVPQNFAPDLLFPISVLEVVLMGRLATAPRLGGFRQADRERALQALQEVGMASVREAPFSSLSGGQKQRVLIARALASDPEVLILDEATANMDGSSIHALLKMLAKRSFTILMVTHDLKSALKNCDRLLCVQGSVTAMSSFDVCQHFESGLYHGVGI